MESKLIKQITPAISLHQYNEIPVIKLNHTVGQAEIALQGAHLFSWKPAYCPQDVLWLSEIEPFKLGTAIRGGIPICYPWFNNAGTPSHGFARISLWQLSDYEVSAEKVRLEFSLFSEQRLIIAKIQFVFTGECEITFTNYAKENAQAALHTYFRVGDIRQLELYNLPIRVFNSLTQTEENVPSPRTIGELVDCVYSAELGATLIQDNQLNRKINVEHINASDIVVWNPWHKPTGGMSETGYQTMVCVESARINKRLNSGERLGVKISLR
ncbi:D-hexose-6-phosphate mutarotase [Basfia succiniciproducens]|uniref:D-hexose-6-phosphate mutarotase n=1 Tax=Basfia succiniciproducens TaxID=653940 RepID=UPI0008D2259A|nr:D-hexose-6-phosphate mutarotase [Basfia succiniciproducens]SEQ50970.1 glucose-6-phosphate 1-epimerase [Basfia succiniciproducens]